MSTDLTPAQSSPFDALRRVDDRGERWSAREVMPHLEYERWERFADAIERAKAACTNSGHDAEHHFRGAGKVIKGGRWGQQTVADYELTRFAAYLLSMNGDPRKQAVANAQTYFAVKTREAETNSIRPADGTPALPQSYADALRELAASVEVREAAERALAIAAPKAETYDVLATAADGELLLGDAAKTLSNDPLIDIGRNRLFTLLNGWNWIYRQGSDGRWRAMQTAITRGWLTERLADYENPRTGELAVSVQVRMTVKGAAEVRKRLLATPALTAS